MCDRVSDSQRSNLDQNQGASCAAVLQEPCNSRASWLGTLLRPSSSSSDLALVPLIAFCKVVNCNGKVSLAAKSAVLMFCSWPKPFAAAAIFLGCCGQHCTQSCNVVNHLLCRSPWMDSAICRLTTQQCSEVKNNQASSTHATSATQAVVS